MAIQMNVTLDSGINVSDAYGKIDVVRGSKDALDFTLTFYLSQSACEGGNTPVVQRSFAFTPDQAEDALRWDKQAYLHLKTLDEFADAIDC